ncbi:hypothetical protein D3C87_1198050 [compost metagenome]
MQRSIVKLIFKKLPMRLLNVLQIRETKTSSKKLLLQIFSWYQAQAERYAHIAALNVTYVPAYHDDCNFQKNTKNLPGWLGSVITPRLCELKIIGA